MNEVTIWHNAKCSKSRATLLLLEQQGHVPRIVHYLVDAPNEDELRRVLDLLGCEPRGLMRTKESLYAELGLADVDDAALLRAMVANPVLIERPIVISGDRAAIGRPPENVLSVLK
jgi:arsenate reductase